MVTDITVVRSGDYGAEDRSWTIGDHDATANAPIDWATFTGANFASGVVKSGCLLGKITATGKYGPFDAAATDGRQTANGYLWDTTKIPADTAQVSTGAVYYHGHVRVSRLPYPSGLGALTAAARGHLTQIRHEG